jgi:ribonuclease HI
MTNQRAEITAAIEACKLCYRILTTLNLDQEIRQIVIKSDSV